MYRVRRFKKRQDAMSFLSRLRHECAAWEAWMSYSQTARVYPWSVKYEREGTIQLYEDQKRDTRLLQGVVG